MNEYKIIKNPTTAKLAQMTKRGWVCIRKRTDVTYWMAR